MGFFRNLWDEALAGPTTPDSKLRRYNSLLSRSIPPPNADNNTPVSRAITILRTNSLSSSASGSTPSSPAGSSAAGSPFSPTSPGGDFKKLTRRKSTADAVNRRASKTPTGYDWMHAWLQDRSDFSGSLNIEEPIRQTIKDSQNEWSHDCMLQEEENHNC